MVFLRCCPSVWTDNVTCSKNMLQDYIILSSYCSRVLGTNSCSHWCGLVFQIPLQDHNVWMYPWHGRFLGPHCVETCTKPQQPAAARVRAVPWGHSGVNQEWHENGKQWVCQAPYHLTPNSNGIWTSIQTRVMVLGLQKPAQSPWTADPTHFFSLPCRLFGVLCACRKTRSVRSALIFWENCQWRNCFLGLFQWTKGTSCENYQILQKQDFYRGDKNGVCQISNFYRHDKNLIKNVYFLSWR